ncbi:hypothetical protein CRE_19506 [Caenorhabditis remanei]|uniref:Uncharacterized protein n=1 Tax=Caenorhabditis remanei TaxID=31234 RepID=E3NG79_CAERE|nr:hypothetical protein CRE_19506 [Caenorhabditis remanei]
MKHTIAFLSCTNFAILICLLYFINQANVIKIFYLKNLKEVFTCIFIHIFVFYVGPYLLDSTSPEVYSAKKAFFQVNIYYLFLINLDLYLFYKYQFLIGDRQTSMDPGRSSVYYVNTEAACNPAANLSNGVDIMTGGPMNEEVDIDY